MSATSFASDDIITSEDIRNNGKEIFQRYGIDENLPKLGLSSLIQGEHLVEHVTRSIEVGDNVKHSEVFLVQDTDAKGNIDLRIKYNLEQLAKNENIIEEIESNTRKEYLLRKYAQSYDSKSVKATDLGNGDAVITFNYSKFGLPQDIAYFRFMNVEINIKNNKPTSMIISNSKPFTFDKYKIDSYHQKINFNILDNGKVVIADKTITSHGVTKKYKPVKLVMTIKPVAYYNDSGISVLNEELLSQVSDPRIHEASVKLDRVFPLMGDMIRRQGIDVPLPYGVSVAYRNQDMNIGFTDFNVMGIDFNDLFDPEESIGTVKAESLSIRGDVNIFPFWNVYGLVGKVNVDANVDAQYTGAIGEGLQEQLNNKLPGLGNAFCKELSVLCNRSTLRVPLHLEYDVVGVGTTLSVGYRQLFASVTGTYSLTKLTDANEWGDGVLTVQPMLGYQLPDYRAQIFIGAEYQGLKPYMNGKVDSVEIGGEVFHYNVGTDINKWAYLIGFNKQMGKHYNLSFLYNKGESRNAMTLNLGYRF
ncbi:hypothetical protein [Vibrio sp. 10N.286.49.B3]|uniref:hypothetical protein n=1 Tax=Vibrio sp. 10N.286.49.B3 TaxID=1880855 RepID=UPI001F537F63|nr:hypothetical protein [Vibrio sp. 10N.286.49.B3]